MEIIRTNKYRLYPNSKQKSLLHNMFGQTRFVFNSVLGMIQECKFGSYINKRGNKIGSIPSQTTLINQVTELKKEHLFLYQIGNDFLQAELNNLYLGTKGFLKGIYGYPKFKSRKNKEQSINLRAGSRARFDSNYIYLPVPMGTQFDKSDFKIKYKKHSANYSLPEKITGYTIFKDNLDRYWISFTFKIELKYKIKGVKGTNKQCGIDLGIKDLIITSDGLEIPNDNLIKKSELKLSFLQRRLSKKKKGSKNRNKARLKVAKCQDKIKNQRNYRNHNITKSLVNVYDFIGVETLAVKNMIKNKSLAKSIANVSWSDIVSKIEYKMTEKQGHLIKIDQFYPSSKTCSNCGSVKQEMPLEIRIYECSECSYTEDRDINAAKNILAEAKRIAGL